MNRRLKRKQTEGRKSMQIKKMKIKQEMMKCHETRQNRIDLNMQYQHSQQVVSHSFCSLSEMLANLKNNSNKYQINKLFKHIK